MTSVSVSEFALLFAIACLVLGGLLFRYAWVRRLAWIAVAAQVGYVWGGEPYAVAFLIAGIAVWAVAAIIHSTSPASRTRHSNS